MCLTAGIELTPRHGEVISMISISASYSEDPEFESRPDSCSMVSLSP